MALIAAVVYFPSRLIPAGRPLDLPPFLAEAGHQPFDAVAAQAGPNDVTWQQDQGTIRVLQILYGVVNPDGSHTVTARVGVQLAGSMDIGEITYDLGTQLTVPGSLAEQVRHARAGIYRNYPTHEDMVRGYVEWADRQ